VKLPVLFPAPACLGLLGPAGDRLPSRASVNLLITGGTVITMDSARRVLEDGAVAIRRDRIIAVGPSRELTARFTARQTIDAHRTVVMPGLIDGHGHAGHGPVQTLGRDTDEWYGATEQICARGSTVGFWRAEALLTGVERVRFGVTTALSDFGGGDMVVRTDDPKYGDAYLQVTSDVGIRFILAVGPRRPPFPRTYAVMIPTHHPDPKADTGTAVAEITSQARAARALSKRYGLLFTQDGHSSGTIQWAVELLDAGATVMLGADGVAPDRSDDMFRHMFQAMRYHRAARREANVLPAGKVLEMVTIDAARALGMEREIGSLESGKKSTSFSSTSAGPTCSR